MDKEYLKEVKKEIINIKKHATAEEIDMLDFFRLNAYNYRQCIYGQMTGNCYSKRATELIRLCCNTKTSFANVLSSDYELIKEKPRLNGLANKGHTYVEHFIVHHEKYNKHIIEFLKGETDKLIIK